MDFTFKKEEKLCSYELIRTLYAKGKGFNTYPIRFNAIEVDLLPVGTMPAQVVIMVPKRLFKKSHDRQKIKRLIREAYRLNKNILYSYLILHNKKLAFSLTFIGNRMPDYKEVEGKIILSLQRYVGQSTKNSGLAGNSAAKGL